jgi:glc operon protein GlcG
MKKQSCFWIAMCLAGLFPVAGARAQALGTKRTLTLDVARAVIAAAEKKAVASHWAMVITVVDDGGHMIALARMDGSPMGSIDVAQRKASSAVRFKSPTKDFSDGMAKGTTALLTLDVVTFEGGIPIVVDGQVIGAIGVSGGTQEQDGQVAAAGLDWFSATVTKK